ncbi:hypothetical protein G7Z17_g12243 [Cylindrodendrum hubeiense]|uniref:Uncharacterized protein n=1 Tax=Cylindrodendrum hubeiense TaxID=595255 RepID=A0A9P5GVT0_9HYPO|nr:hypothetical protein G7Z17_g12243 [Cylindrodendrum hubeiense]
MPSSPHTPRHSRNSSAFDSYSGSPQNRRLSKSSVQDPSTPYRNSFNQPDELDMSVLASGGAGAGNGMGNLADELADAFSDSGDEGEYDDGDLDGESLGFDEGHPDEASGAKGINSPSGDDGDRTGPTSLTLLSPRRGHQRQKSEYDGSEYGSESDLESPGMPPGLVAKIDAVESLARRGNENVGGPADDVFKRVTTGLRDLGSQSSVEASASRRLRSAKEIVAEMRREEELKEEGERWLTRGNWGERLEKRECAGVCGDVIGGFEEVCNGWRERLLAQAESQA